MTTRHEELREIRRIGLLPLIVNRDPSSKAVVATILGREAGETFEVSPELDLELQESIAQAERGEAIPVAAVLDRLRRIA